MDQPKAVEVTDLTEKLAIDAELSTETRYEEQSEKDNVILEFIESWLSAPVIQQEDK